MMKKCVLALLLSLPLIAQAADTEERPVANLQVSDFVQGKKAVADKNWQAAVDAFKRALKSEPRNPDIHNMLGYSYRNLSQMDLSFKHYNEALSLDPDHRGANHYIGIAYLKSNQLEKAKEHLARLEQICGTGCDQYLDLSKAIAAYK